MFRPLSIFLLSTPLLWALPLITHKTIIPTAVSSSTLNLQNYLNFQSDHELNMACVEQKVYLVCQIPKYRHENIDEFSHEVTEVTGMSKAEIYFEQEILEPLLSKKMMMALYSDMTKIEAINEKNSPKGSEPIFYEQESSSLQDSLDEHIAEALRSLQISDFYLQEKNSSNTITIKEIKLLNDMKRSAGNQHYDYAVFGDLSLTLKAIKSNKKQYHTYTEQLIESLEETFEKQEAKRKEYVSKHLNQITSKEFDLPSDMILTLQNRPAKNDKIDVQIMLNMHNSAGTLSRFELEALITGASEFLLKKTQKNPVSTDFIIEHLLLLSTWGSADVYAKALKNDVRFKKYINQYRAKIDELLFKEITQSSDKVLESIIQKLRTALHHLLDGTSDTLKIELKSKNNTSVTHIGKTYMQAAMMASMGDGKNTNNSTGATSILNQEYFIYIEDSKSKK